jgi:hypothetical protein
VAHTTEEVINGRGKHSRKHKSTIIEADKPEADEPEPEVARIINVPVPWRAPVIRII